MIQRIQSIYLLLGTILSIAMLISGIFVVSDGEAFAFIGAFGIQEGALEIEFLTPIPIMILSGGTIAIQGYSIFLFKNRKLQIMLVRINAFLTILMIAWVGYMYYELLGLEMRINPLSGAIHPLLIVFANVLALRGIKKDEALVKSVDRLR